MIYFISLISGFLNGAFASGAGQIIIFYLVFIKKIDTYLGRAISLMALTITSTITLINYLKFINVKYSLAIYIVLISALFGFIGNKVMFKINKNILNLISGTLLFLLSIYGVAKCYI